MTLREIEERVQSLSDGYKMMLNEVLEAQADNDDQYDHSEHLVNAYDGMIADLDDLITELREHL